ncbi:MAG: STAS domain-containing protein [bacterium]|nr:STAS domain-containing protein [bacterium]MCP5042869.1 STAS domain-containing protein [bacterium]
MAVTSEGSREGKELTIRVSGRFDFSLHEEFQNAYSGLVEAGAQVVVDLEHVDYMDSSALGMLLLLREHVGEDSSHVQLINGNPEIRNILYVSNFDQLFKIE